MTEAELTRMRESVNRGRPYGHEAWQHSTAVRLGLESSLRARGRPGQDAVKRLEIAGLIEERGPTARLRT